MRKCGACVLFASAVSVLAFNPMAKAQTVSGSETGFGNLDQNSTLLNTLTNTACVPTSVANSLTYLNNVYDNYSTVKTLETDMGTTTAGTAYGNEVNGLQTFLTTTSNPDKIGIAGGQYVSSLVVGSGAPAVESSLTSVVQNTLPTASFLASALYSKEAVTVWIQWGYYTPGTSTFNPYGGVSSVTLTSITDNLSTGKGTISFLDPWGAATSSGTAVAYNNVSLSTSADGYLCLSGVGTTEAEGTGNMNPPFEADGGPPGLTGRIISDLDEDALVPEPSTYLAGSLLLLPFAFSLVRKFRGAAKTAE